MTATEVPTKSKAAGTAWSDLKRILGALPMQAGIALVIAMCSALAQLVIFPPTPEITIGSTLGGTLVGMVQAFLLTPYLIAVHRFIILGEVASVYALTPGDPRFQHFFGWSLALTVLFLIPVLLGLMVPVATGWQIAIGMCLGILAVIVALRTVILFPAIAVDAPHANWRAAMDDMKGHAWRVVFIGLLAYLPIIIASVVLSIASVIVYGVPNAEHLSLGYRIVQAVFNGVASWLGFTLAVAIASRLFECFGNRVKQV
jgi:hypothetical protein